MQLLRYATKTKCTVYFIVLPSQLHLSILFNCFLCLYGIKLLRAYLNYLENILFVWLSASSCISTITAAGNKFRISWLSDRSSDMIKSRRVEYVLFSRGRTTWSRGLFLDISAVILEMCCCTLSSSSIVSSWSWSGHRFSNVWQKVRPLPFFEAGTSPSSDTFELLLFWRLRNLSSSLSYQDAYVQME